MKVVSPGNKYVLDSFEGTRPQEIQFIVGVSVAGGPPQVGIDGTTNEDVLAVLIHRLGFMQQQSPCRETAIALTKLQESLFWLDFRSGKIKGRHV